MILLGQANRRRPSGLFKSETSSRSSTRRFQLFSVRFTNICKFRCRKWQMKSMKLFVNKKTFRKLSIFRYCIFFLLSSTVLFNRIERMNDRICLMAISRISLPKVGCMYAMVCWWRYSKSNGFVWFGLWYMMILQNKSYDTT